VRWWKEGGSEEGRKGEKGRGREEGREVGRGAGTAERGRDSGGRT